MTSPRAAQTIFVDRSLGRGVQFAIAQAGVDARWHDDYFPKAALDTEWIPVVAGWRWIILTKDARIRRVAAEHQAVSGSGAMVVILSSGNLTGARMADLFVSRLQAILGFAAANRPPFIAVLDRLGKLRPAP